MTLITSTFLFFVFANNFSPKCLILPEVIHCKSTTDNSIRIFTSQTYTSSEDYLIISNSFVGNILTQNFQSKPNQAVSTDKQQEVLSRLSCDSSNVKLQFTRLFKGSDLNRIYLDTFEFKTEGDKIALEYETVMVSNAIHSPHTKKYICYSQR